METHPNISLVKFHYLVSKFRFPRTSVLKSFLIKIFYLENTPFESLTCVFCTDDYLLEINRSYLSHDYYTDIITFNLADGTSVAGELYISIDRVRENASELNVSFHQELLRVIFHGILHLCGYKDSTPKEKQVMRAIEDKYLNLYAS